MEVLVCVMYGFIPEGMKDDARNQHDRIVEFLCGRGISFQWAKNRHGNYIYKMDINAKVRLKIDPTLSEPSDTKVNPEGYMIPEEGYPRFLAYRRKLKEVTAMHRGEGYSPWEAVQALPDKVIAVM